MKVLIIGSGGREHAIIKTLIRQNFAKNDIYCAPGNAGIGNDAHLVEIAPTDIETLKNWALNNQIDLSIASMDDSLAAGIVDTFTAAGLKIFGPTKAQAQMESSKSFAKEFMRKYNIPTADYQEFTDYQTALDYIESKNTYPVVIKADGLALGKGVIIPQNFNEAKEALQTIMIDKAFGASGDKVVIEDFLVGSEISVLAFVDGNNMEIMPASKDHKKIFDGEQGPNTGGMGTFCPAIDYNSELGHQVENEIFAPTLQGLKAIGFKGIIFFGIILTADGPKVLEYNARFGDPEAQVVLPLLETPLIALFEQCIAGNLQPVKWSNKSSICVMLASQGYPGSYKKGLPITGLDKLSEDIIVYHSGTAIKDGQLVTAGGRVLGITAIKDDLASAAKTVYEEIPKIHFEGMQFRSDIDK